MHDIVPPPHAVTTNRRWAVGTLLSLLIMVNYMERGNLTIAIPVIKHSLKLDNLQAGMILAAFQGVYAFSNVPMGWIVDRFGPRRVIMFAGTAWTFCAAATGLANSLVALMIIRACLGVSESPIFPAGIKVVDSWFPNREKARAIAMYEVAGQIGVASGPLLGAIFILSLGWHLMFVAMASLGVLPVAIWFIFYRQPENDSRLKNEERALIMAERKQSRLDPASISEWFGLFTYPQSWLLFFGGMSFAGWQGFYLWLPIYLREARHFSLVHAGGSVSLLSLGGIAGLIVGSLFSDQLIRRGRQPLSARRITIVLGALLGGAAISCTAFFQSDAGLLTTLAIGSFAGGSITASWWSLVPVVAPNPRLVASLGSMQNSGIMVGSSILPVVIGGLLDHGYNFYVIISVSAAFSLLSATIYGVLLRKPIVPRRPAEDRIIHPAAPSL